MYFIGTGDHLPIIAFGNGMKDKVQWTSKDSKVVSNVFCTTSLNEEEEGGKAVGSVRWWVQYKKLFFGKAGCKHSWLGIPWMSAKEHICIY